MRKAAIDIGTNSTRLYIADVDCTIKRIEKHTTITRLGSGVDRDHMLSSEAIERNLKVLKEYRRICEAYGIKDIKAIATSAVRDALNRDEFLRRAREEASIDIEVISGREEAELGYLGASTVMSTGKGVAIDIGGGSTELILGAKGSIKKLKSIDIGAVRMTERFSNTNKITSESISNASNYIMAELSHIVQDFKNTGDLDFAGIGGTITTLAAIDQELKVYDIERVHGYKLMKSRVDIIFDRLISMSLESRKNIPGLQPLRADIIPLGTLILKLIMEILDFGCILVSESDNLDGIMMKYVL